MKCVPVVKTQTMNAARRRRHSTYATDPGGDPGNWWDNVRRIHVRYPRNAEQVSVDPRVQAGSVLGRNAATIGPSSPDSEERLDMDVTSVTASGAAARPVQVSANVAATAAYARAEKPGVVRGSDTVEVSAQARAAAKAGRARRSEDAPVRLDLVTRVRDEIQQGTYVTLPKMDQAIRELTPELVGN